MTKTQLLLCPGLLNDAALWRHQCETLADVADIAVADLTVADSVAGLACAILDRAPPRFALAGLSMGGYVSFEIMRRAPERVSRLALFDTRARLDPEDSRIRRRELIDIARRGGFSKLPPQMLAGQLHPDHAKDPEIARTVLAMAERIGADAFIRQQTAILGRPDSLPGLSAISVPTLVAGGRQDTITPPVILQEISDGIPGARLVIIEDAGHLAPLEQPHAVSALLRYWLQG
ncbi:alpha/beta fold hydrolase [Telmatospirillum siberiense]|uniref:Alpha/beta hydrolase n=1 Tax=Telmatospirillum siberiense TaxID=382514 RepID=A0A2N3Q0Y5_9PROT|nr:alpha/beta fold hydrolase [Telmatospirillum siberiense]PKU26319.1 alpha/beta hydrolase [Telmatospirillum siberiense]